MVATLPSPARHMTRQLQIAPTRTERQASLVGSQIGAHLPESGVQLPATALAGQEAVDLVYIVIASLRDVQDQPAIAERLRPVAQLVDRLCLGRGLGGDRVFQVDLRGLGEVVLQRPRQSLAHARAPALSTIRAATRSIGAVDSQAAKSRKSSASAGGADFFGWRAGFGEARNFSALRVSCAGVSLSRSTGSPIASAAFLMRLRTAA